MRDATGQTIRGWLAPALTHTPRTLGLLAELTAAENVMLAPLRQAGERGAQRLLLIPEESWSPPVLRRAWLHASRLAMTHPALGDAMSWHSPSPVWPR